MLTSQRSRQRSTTPAARPLADVVAEVEDPGDAAGVDVGEDGLQCGEVAVDVGDQRDPLEGHAPIFKAARSTANLGSLDITTAAEVAARRLMEAPRTEYGLLWCGC